MDKAAPDDARRERLVPLLRDERGGWWVTSGELLGPEGRLAVIHLGQAYQLRVTRQNKLILTK